MFRHLNNNHLHRYKKPNHKIDYYDKLLRTDGPAKKDLDEGGIEFEGVHIDDDPTASMVVMRRFLFYTEDAPQHTTTTTTNKPIFKIEKAIANGDTISISASNIDNTLTTVTHKSSRRVTLFEGRYLMILK